MERQVMETCQCRSIWLHRLFVPDSKNPAHCVSTWGIKR
jgi:hypothetical protein